jgi:hypothetical protein
MGGMRKSRDKRRVKCSVADPDPHEFVSFWETDSHGFVSFWEPDPHQGQKPDPHQS